MRRIRVAVSAVAAGLLVSTAALAQTEDRPTTYPSTSPTSTTTTSRTSDSGSTISGKVTNVNVSGRSFTVESPSGTMTFQTNTSTQVSKATSGTEGSAMPDSGTTGSMGTLSNLKVGDEVRVAYSGTSSSPTAMRVEVMSPGSMTGTRSSLGSTGTMGSTSTTTGSTTGTTGTTTGSTYGTGTGMGTTGTTGTTTGSTYGTTGTAGTTGTTGTTGTAGMAGTTTGSTYGTTGTTGTTTTGSSTYGTTGTTGTAGTSTTPSMMGSSVTGRVVSVDTTANTITVETRNGRETFRANNTSRYMSSGRAVTINDLHAGDNVTLSFTGTGSDRMISRAEVTTGSSAAATTRTTTTTTTPSSEMDDDDADLPATAGPIPAFLAAGLVLLTTGLAMRLRRRRS